MNIINPITIFFALTLTSNGISVALPSPLPVDSTVRTLDGKLCNEYKTSDLNGTEPFKECVGLVGYPCINSRCTEFASCSEGICVCDEHFYYVNDSNTCVPKVKVLEKCSDTAQCEQLPGQTLICLNGICNCDPSISVYATAQASVKYSEKYGFTDIERETYSYSAIYYTYENGNFHGYVGPVKTQCVGLAGSPCIDRLCAPNSYCTYPIHKNSMLRNENDTCECLGGYTRSKSRTCGQEYRSTCTSSSTCLHGLACMNSRCLCRFANQIYDHSRETCLSRIGGPCDSNSSCEQRAFCKFSLIKDKEGSGSAPGAGHCNCKEGYVENWDGKCEAGFNTECSTTSDCDSIAGLECIDLKCQCKDFAGFNTNWRKCVGLVGAKCNFKKDDECTENSHCIPHSHRDLPGRCTCKPGFEETSNYTCEVSELELAPLNRKVSQEEVMTQNVTGPSLIEK